MSKFQKLSQINKDIELLENAGKLVEADILHKKFIREAQYVMPQMMPMMMPQMMMPQMMMARPTMPVAPAAVPRPVAPVAQPAPVAAPAPKPAPAPAPIGETPKPGTTPAPPPPPPPPTGQATPPGGITYQVSPPQSMTLPPSNDERFDYYNGKIFQGYQIEDPRQRQQYLDNLKKKIKEEFDNKRLDPRHKEIFDDMFAGG